MGLTLIGRVFGWLWRVGLRVVVMIRLRVGMLVRLSGLLVILLRGLACLCKWRSLTDFVRGPGRLVGKVLKWMVLRRLRCLLLR